MTRELGGHSQRRFAVVRQGPRRLCKTGKLATPAGLGDISIKHQASGQCLCRRSPRGKGALATLTWDRAGGGPARAVGHHPSANQPAAGEGLEPSSPGPEPGVTATGLPRRARGSINARGAPGSIADGKYRNAGRPPASESRHAAEYGRLPPRAGGYRTRGASTGEIGWRLAREGSQPGGQRTAAARVCARGGGRSPRRLMALTRPSSPWATLRRCYGRGAGSVESL